MTKFISLLLATAALAAPASAATNVTIINPSFEQDVQQYNNYTRGAHTGWYSDNAGSTNFGPSLTVADGAQAIFLNGLYLYQTVGTLAQNTNYTLTVYAGNKAEYGPGSEGSINLLNGDNNSGTVLAVTALSSLPVGTMAPFSVDFRTGSSVSGNLTIAMFKTSGLQIDFDHVQLTASGAVPEPASWAMLIAGFGLTGAAARRRRRMVAVAA